MERFDLKRPRCCSCCGDQVVIGRIDCPNYRRVHFRLSGGDPLGNTTFWTFCPDCADHEWTPERLQQINALLQSSWEDNLNGLVPTYSPERGVWERRQVVTPMQEPDRTRLLDWYRSLTITGLDERYPASQTWAEVA